MPTAPSTAPMPPRIAVVALMGLVNLLERVRRAVLPPELYLMDTAMFGAIRSHAVLTAMRLSLFEALRDGPSLPAEVAAKLETDPDSTRRLMRALASFGVLDGQGARYALNRMSRLLLLDAEAGLGAGLLANADPRQYVAWSRLADAMRGTTSAFEIAFGAPFFEHLHRDRELGDLFDRGMRGWSLPTIQAVCAAWRPPDGAHIIDVGGGHGGLLAALLARNPTATGTLFDLPPVLTGAEETLAPVSDRAARVAGCFHEGVPAGADVYTLMNVLHDWGDAGCIRILKSCRAAMSPKSRLLVIDMIVPPGNPAHPGPIVDLLMMCLFREGRERTEAELRALADAAGLVVEHVIPTSVPSGILVLKLP